MAGLSSILDIGRWALSSSQSSIEVTGSNISNVNTPGYSRRSVRLEEGQSIDFNPGQIGTGVRAKEVVRHFNKFVEEQYNTKASLRERWDTLQGELSNVELIFNESDGGGLGDALSAFWQDWQDLSLRPEDGNARSVLLNHASSLVGTLEMTMEDLERFQNRTDEVITQEVNQVNDLIARITDLNGQISIHEVPGQNNPNALLDERDGLIRELAEKIDIDVIDNGSGNLSILTKAGHTLVDGKEKNDLFRLAFEGPRTTQDLMSTSDFDGQVYYEGDSDHEYTIQMASDGTVGGGASFKVSVDGGRTWLSDANGNEEFQAEEFGQRIMLPTGELTLWFGAADNPQNPPDDNNLTEGDTFTIVPKSGLYWYENTSSSMNVTPQAFSNGSDNERRVTGGTLGGLFQLRDHYIGKYKDNLDAFAEGLAWEVNRLHTQGVGMNKITDVTGSARVINDTVPLGSAGAGLPPGDRLQSGNISLFVYDADTGELNASADQISFDPGADSLEDLRDSLNGIDHINATITSDNRLQIAMDDGYELAFGTDTTGVLTGLGINTFFDGNTASNLKLSTLVANNADMIATGHVNGAGEVNQGDNAAAAAIAGLKEREVTLETMSEGSLSMTIDEFYNSLVGNVGADTEMAKFNFTYQKSLADDLNARQEEVAGVNLDEEMSNLIKFQHSYNAAAKLILTSDKLMQTLLGMKQ